MTSILLVRHGENAYTAEGRLAGHLPVALNEHGTRQAELLATHLASLPIGAIYASPLLRTQQTATPLANKLNLPLHPLNGMQEVDFGAWQGRLLKELRREKSWKSVQNQPASFTFPGGESFLQAQTRAVSAIQALSAKHAGKKELVAVFSHSDIIKLVLSFYLGQPLDLFQRIVIQTASISRLMLQDGACWVVSVNQTSHL